MKKGRGNKDEVGNVCWIMWFSLTFFPTLCTEICL